MAYQFEEISVRPSNLKNARRPNSSTGRQSELQVEKSSRIDYGQRRERLLKSALRLGLGGLFI